MPLNAYNIILILIIFQSILFAAVLFSHQKGKIISNRILGSLLAIIGLQMLSILLRFQNIYRQELESIGCSFGLLYGVCFYFYTISLIYQKIKFRQLDLLHLLPFVCSIVFVIFGYPFCQYWGNLLYISIIGYLIASLYKIRGYKRVIKNTTSIAEQANLSWLRLMLILFSITILMDLFHRIIDYFQITFLDEFIGFSVFGLVLIFVNTMVYKGLKQPGLFLGISEEDEQIASELEQSHLTPVDQTLIDQLEKVHTFMLDKRPYLNPSLTIGELAQLLELAPKKLSQMINQIKNQNFSEFINHYRIEAAKERLKYPIDSKETILEVMYDVGFNSKSVFNTLFKKHTGLTPTQYRAKNQSVRP